MSQFSTMTTRERKMQAAAICREFQGPEDVEMDLGRKVNAPQEIMYEELSLSSNRGSRLFKMRQKRSEKYTFESVQNITNTETNNEMVAEDGNTAENQNSENDLGVNQPPESPSHTPDIRTDPSPEDIAPGYGGPIKDVPPEKFNCTAIPKSYQSPWAQAIIHDPDLKDTLDNHMPEPPPRTELPGYKSFNRVATPFGGFHKAHTPAPISTTQLEPVLLADYPELPVDTTVKQASFNRTAMGWVSTGIPVLHVTASSEPMFVPESDDL